MVNIGSGQQQLNKGYRDGLRCLIESQKLTEYLFEIVKDHVPSNICAENGQGKLAFILSSNLIEIRTNVNFLIKLITLFINS